MQKLEAHYPAIVIGGGMAGVCAAIALARGGVQTALVQDRPVLGGNSSAEINVPFGSADNKGTCRHSRETGILDELLVENAYFPNPSDPKESQGFSGSIWSVVLWAAAKEAGVSLYLNTVAKDPVVENGRIVAITAEQITTEKQWRMTGEVFLDCSGDGRVAYESGAEVMRGREARSLYGESMAPEEADGHTMGNSVYIRARDLEVPSPFERPAWAYPIQSDADLPGGLADCPHNPKLLKGHPGGYWWIEYGGMFDTIADAEWIHEELLRYAVGVWDHIKNHGDHGAETYVLDGINVISGKRESRRFVGDVILTQHDLVSRSAFEDVVAYGGWNIDLHYPKGISDKLGRYWHGLDMPGRYGIPLSALYSKNIHNLFFAGRNISASHVAFGSTRVMATAAVMGQAVGTAARLCLKYGCSPREVRRKHIRELQQLLLREDAYLPGVGNQDPRDLARQATVTASSEGALCAWPPMEYRVADTELAQSFFASAVRRVRLPMRNGGLEAVQVTVALRTSPIIDLLDGAETIAQATAELQPGQSEVWFDFGEEYFAPKRCFMIAMPRNEQISWGWTDAEPPATNAGELAEDGLFRRQRGTFCFEAEPSVRCYAPEMVVSGVARPESESNLWLSREGMPQWLQLDWPAPVRICMVEICFDNNLDTPIRRYADHRVAPTLAREYTLSALTRTGWQVVAAVRGNRNRRRRHGFPSLAVSAVRLEVEATNGAPQVGVYEVRAYGEESLNG